MLRGVVRKVGYSVISRVTIAITHSRGFIALLIATHEPFKRDVHRFGFWVFGKIFGSSAKFGVRDVGFGISI